MMENELRLTSGSLKRHHRSASGSNRNLSTEVTAHQVKTQVQPSRCSC